MFKPATKTKSRLRLALMGPSGSGKTFTALRFASLLAANRKIAYIDTENGSAAKYAGEAPDGSPWAFDVLDMVAPYSPKRFADAIRAAEAAGYDVVVIDSLTHMWSGRGGMLDIVDEKSRGSRSGNSFEAWGAAKPMEREFWDALVSCKIDLICCFRSKSEWVIEKNANGKNAPRKIGLKAEQRDGVEYEFDVALMLDEDNHATVVKTRCSALTGLSWTKPGREVVDPLRAWLSDGTEAPAAPSPAAPSPVAAPSAASELEGRLAALADADWPKDAVKAWGATSLSGVRRLCSLVLDGDDHARNLYGRLGRRITAALEAGVLDGLVMQYGPPSGWLEGDVAEAHARMDTIGAALKAAVAGDEPTGREPGMEG